MKTLKIDVTDIFLEDGKRVGQGKITISDAYMGAFTTSWGAMGCNISEFLCGINEYYFADCLLDIISTDVFDSKRSVKNIRKHIKEELAYELPWYRYMSAQKEMRLKLKELENCSSDREFVDGCNSFVDILWTDLPYKEEAEFKDIIRDVFENEPWHFISTKQSPTFIWLCGLHKKIKKELN